MPKREDICFLCQGQGSVIRGGKRMVCTNCGGSGAFDKDTKDPLTESFKVYDDSKEDEEKK